MAVSINDGSLEWIAGVDNSKLKSDVDDTIGQLSRIGKQVDAQNSKIGELARKAAAGVATYLTVTAATNFIRDMVKIRGEFQQLEVAFTTMLGSKEKADKLMKEITEFAATTPFELSEVAAATKQLLAFGIAAEDIQKTLRMLGDVSAGIGAPIGEIAYLFGTIKTQGVALTQDVRQFAQRGIPVYEELAKILKVSTEQVGDFITAGKVGFPEIQKVFQNLTAEGSKFGGLMEAQSQTLVGKLSNLQDAVAQMFNELGKSQEGLFSDTLSGLTTIVENYQVVIDILKALVIAYGSYKAAMITATVVQRVQQQMLLQQALTTNKLTTAQALNAVMTLNLQRAWKALNVTIAANPIALLVGTLTALVGAMVLFRDSTTKIKTSVELLNEAADESNKKFGEQEASIKSLVSQLQNQLLSERQRLSAYEELKRIAPDVIQNLSFEEAKTKDLTDAVNTYIAALKQKIQFESKQTAYAAALKQQEEAYKKAEDIAKKSGSRQLTETRAVVSQTGAQYQTFVTEFGKASIQFREASNAVLKIEKELNTAIGSTSNAIKERLDFLKSQQSYFSEGDDTFKYYQSQIDSLSKSYEAALKREGGAKQDAIVKNRAYYEAEIERLKLLQSGVEVNSKAYREYARQIKAIENLLNPKSGGANKVENEREKLLEKNLNLVERINQTERDANQTGLTDKAKAIAQINEKYNQQLNDLQKLNDEIKKYNEKNGSNPLALLGQKEVNQINLSRDKELRNLQYRQDAESFIKATKDKESVFAEYQKVLETGNDLLIRKFRETYANDLEGFSSYIELLQGKLQEFNISDIFDGSDLYTTLAIEELNKLLDEAQKAAAEKTKQTQQANFEQLISEAQNYNLKLSAINEKYDQQERTLTENRNKFTLDQYTALQDDIAKRRKQDIDTLNDDFAKGIPQIQKLFDGIENMADTQTKKFLKEIQAILDDLIRQGKISKEFADRLQQAINDAGDGVARKQIEAIGQLSSVIDGLANEAGKFNEELKNALSSLSNIVKAVGQIKTGLADFKAAKAEGGTTGAIGMVSSALGIVGAVYSYVNGIIEGIKAANESRKKAQAEIAAFQLQILKGEIDINILYRERAIEQARLNKLRLEGIKAEADALKQAQQKNLEDYNRLFAQLQNEQFVAGTTTKKRRGSFFNVFGGLVGMFANTRTEVKQELQSLAGKTYDDIEKLFMSGQLTDKAKELFQQLQKLKQEGVDIDRALEAAREQAKELYTGTTSNSIADSIIEGFRQGKRSASDFADDFQALMQNAVLQALKFRALEGPLNDFYDQFAAASESDNALTSSEIEQLQNIYNSIIENAASQFEQLQSIANLNFAPGQNGSGNALQGAIKGMTEQQAELLAGQFGGLRMTAADQLRIATESLRVMQNIEANTYRLHQLTDTIRRIEIDGLKVK